MNYDDLIATLNELHQAAQSSAAKAVNRGLLFRNWLIGGYIVQFEQQGDDRATYGTGLLKRLSTDLKERNVAGVSPDVLERMRRFFLTYPHFQTAISATASRNFLGATEKHPLNISATPSRKSETGDLPTPLREDSLTDFSWSHFVELIRIDDPWKRAFYENECLQANWSVRELKRQVGSLLYERTGLSTDKQAVIEAARAEAAAPPGDFAEILRDPYILEFTGLAERPSYIERDLESSLLDHLQAFLLELGAGFCFEARQKRITVGNEHDYVDLVFYHRILRCHILIDLKIRAFQHGDAGQMNFYLNYWKDQMTEPGDQPPIGLLLCSDHDHTKVEYATAGMDEQLFVSRYLVALPKPEELQAFVERDRAEIEAKAELDAKPETEK